jgi:hypothetical protein
MMMEFSHSVAQLTAMGNRIRDHVVYAKQNKQACREIGLGVQALAPVLADVEEKYPSFPQATQDTLARFLPKLKKCYDDAADFIEAQIKVGSAKKFNTSKNTKYMLDTLGRNLKNAKETLIAALFERVDPSVCTTPIPSTVGIDKHIESMYMAFCTENYMQALQLGKEILRKIPADDALAKAGVHYDMACTYAKLCNTRNVVLHLQSARVYGFSDFKQLDEDSDFDNVRFQPEFMNFRQMMEYEVLQTEKWRELSDNLILKLSARFDKYDEEGKGTLTFPQFGALCRGEFAISSPAQIVAFWRESCEDTIESMHLMEFLNFMAEHKDMNGLLTQDSPNSRVKSLYRGYSPIHTSTMFSADETSRHLIQAHSFTPFQCAPFPYSVEQTCGWMGEMHKTASEHNLSSPAPFSYYTTTDPFSKFRW